MIIWLFAVLHGAQGIAFERPGVLVPAVPSFVEVGAFVNCKNDLPTKSVFDSQLLAASISEKKKALDPKAAAIITTIQNTLAGGGTDAAKVAIFLEEIFKLEHAKLVDRSECIVAFKTCVLEFTNGKITNAAFIKALLKTVRWHGVPQIGHWEGYTDRSCESHDLKAKCEAHGTGTSPCRWGPGCKPPPDGGSFDQLAPKAQSGLRDNKQCKDLPLIAKSQKTGAYINLFSFSKNPRDPGLHMLLQPDPHVDQAIPITWLQYVDDKCTYAFVREGNELASTSEINGCHMYVAEKVGEPPLLIHANYNQCGLEPIDRESCHVRKDDLKLWCEITQSCVKECSVCGRLSAAKNDRCHCPNAHSWCKRTRRDDTGSCVPNCGRDCRHDLATDMDGLSCVKPSNAAANAFRKEECAKAILCLHPGYVGAWKLEYARYGNVKGCLGRTYRSCRAAVGDGCEWEDRKGVCKDPLPFVSTIGEQTHPGTWAWHANVRDLASPAVARLPFVAWNADPSVVCNGAAVV